ncbi:MAG: hypothetical protein O6947_01145 [Acidobacteria bacterium]|nr:hypothetical protein [Acidobacteriota bacterium]
MMIPLLAGTPVRAEEEEKKPLPPRKTVKGHMQSRPGGPTWDVEVKVHPAPDDLPSVPAAAAPINDSDLVLGVVLDGQAVAFPIRFLAMYEVIDSRVVVAKNGNGRPYYYFRPGSERDRTLKMHDTSSLGLGIAAGEESLFFPFRELNKADLPIQAELNGEKIKILYEKKEMTAWAVDPEGTLLSGVLAYQSGWLRFFPDSKVFKNKRSRR